MGEIGKEDERIRKNDVQRVGHLLREKEKEIREGQSPIRDIA